MVQSTICDLIQYRLRTKKESKFELTKSRRCFIVADPTRTLKPKSVLAPLFFSPSIAPPQRTWFTAVMNLYKGRTNT